MKQALIIIDLQNDFLPGGSLAVANGDQIIAPINQLMDHFDLVIASQDCHPKNHISFAKTWNKRVGEVILENGVEQMLWPVHCVEDTFGAQFPSSFNSYLVDQIFYKGCLEKVDSYSVFIDQFGSKATDIDSYLNSENVQHLTFVGLATDYCVKASVLDALKLSYQVQVVYDACKAVNICVDDEKKALNEMKEKGACLISFKEILQASPKTVSF